MCIFKFIQKDEVCRIKEIAKKYKDVEFLQYQHINPKLKERNDSPAKSAARYDKYRMAKSPKTFKKLGGKSNDLIWDFEHGYVIFDIKKIEDSHNVAECHTDVLHLKYIQQLMTERKK